MAPAYPHTPSPHPPLGRPRERVRGHVGRRGLEGASARPDRSSRVTVAEVREQTLDVLDAVNFVAANAVDNEGVIVRSGIAHVVHVDLLQPRPGIRVEAHEALRQRDILVRLAVIRRRVLDGACCDALISVYKPALVQMPRIQVVCAAALLCDLEKGVDRFLYELLGQLRVVHDEGTRV